MTHEFFATTAKGVEDVLAAELTALGIAATAASGGASFRGDLATMYKANLWATCASRILMPVADFPCASPQELYDGVRSVPWNSYLTPSMTLAVECSLRDSALTHSGFVALKTKDAIVDTIRDRCGVRPNVDTKDPHLRVNVRLFRNRCTVSLDSSGFPLDRRGYRLDRHEAPLKESLAAALIALSGWDASVPFVDPMCGTGTIAIEAALKATRRPPGLQRTFGFQRWPGFDRLAWSALIKEARRGILPAPPAPIAASDISAAAIAMAQENARRAGVGDLITFSVAPIAELRPQETPGVLIFNPPYGKRLGEEEELKPLYKEIGDVMKQRCKGCRAYLFTGNLELAKSVGLKASRRMVLFNGPIECRLLKYDLY